MAEYSVNEEAVSHVTEEEVELAAHDLLQLLDKTAG